MKTEAEVVLYTRADCHLCELAAQMLAATGVRWREIDIGSDPDLTARYGLSIPVVYLGESGQELHFPFDDAGLARFLAV